MKKILPSLLISIPKGIIDLGWGHPSTNLHPVEYLNIAAKKVLSEDSTALQYGAMQGYGPLLESLSIFLSKEPSYNYQVNPTNLFLTGGASQAIDFTTTLFTKAGDTVFLENPTYYLVEKIFQDHHLNVIPIPTDSFGMNVDALEKMLNDDTIPNPKLIYTIPVFQNPTGVVLPMDRRQKLINLAEEFNFKILADEVYQLLYYDSLPPKPMVLFDKSKSGCVISLGSFSKILAPGLRLGWIHANPSIINVFQNAGITESGGGFNHFTSNLVNVIIELGLLKENIINLKETYKNRINSITNTLKSFDPDRLVFLPPSGGYFFWLTFKNNIDTNLLLQIARKNGVSFRPGIEFSPDNSYRDSLRISLALYESADLTEGLTRLDYSLNEYLNTFA